MLSWGCFSPPNATVSHTRQKRRNGHNANWAAAAQQNPAIYSLLALSEDEGAASSRCDSLLPRDPTPVAAMSSSSCHAMHTYVATTTLTASTAASPLQGPTFKASSGTSAKGGEEGYTNAPDTWGIKLFSKNGCHEICSDHDQQRKQLHQPVSSLTQQTHQVQRMCSLRRTQQVEHIASTT